MFKVIYNRCGCGNKLKGFYYYRCHKTCYHCGRITLKEDNEKCTRCWYYCRICEGYHLYNNYIKI